MYQKKLLKEKLNFAHFWPFSRVSQSKLLIFHQFTTNLPQKRVKMAKNVQISIFPLVTFLVHISGSFWPNFSFQGTFFVVVVFSIMEKITFIIKGR